VSHEEYLALGIIAIIAVVAIWFNFRDSYTDLKEHPPEDKPHGLRLGISWDDGVKTVTIGQNLTLAAGIAGRYQPTEEDRAEDEAFTAALEIRFGSRIEPCFYQKVAGVKHLNADRTRRSTIIKRCTPLEVLWLVREPDNPVDPKAVAVVRSDGSQLGYLPWRSAAEINEELCSQDCELVAIFRRHNRHPETDRVVGATILLARLKQ